MPAKWGSLLQQILDAFDLNYIFDPWYTLPIRGGRLWSAKNGLCRRRAGTGDWVGWSEKLKNANLDRMQNSNTKLKIPDQLLYKKGGGQEFMSCYF